MAVAGCGDGGLCPRALEARLGMRREESWRRGITVLRLTLLRQEGNVEETGAAPFPVHPNVVRLLLSLFWPLYDISHFWLPLLHPPASKSFLCFNGSSASLSALILSFYGSCISIFHIGKPPAPMLSSCMFGYRDLERVTLVRSLRLKMDLWLRWSDQSQSWNFC